MKTDDLNEAKQLKFDLKKNSAVGDNLNIDDRKSLQASGATVNLKRKAIKSLLFTSLTSRHDLDSSSFDLILFVFLIHQASVNVFYQLRPADLIVSLKSRSDHLL